MAAAEDGNGLSSDHERGSRLGMLVLNSPKWVHRRVDTVTFNPDVRMHHRISFDLTVPEGLAVRGSAGRVIVPLALMEKGRLRTGLSAEDPIRGFMPILETGECAPLAVGMLRALLAPFGEAGGGRADLEDALDRIVRLPGEASDEEKAAALGEWDAWLGSAGSSGVGDGEGRLEHLGQVDSLVRALVGSELLIAELEESYVGTRCVLKVAYDTDLEISRSPRQLRAVRFRVPGFGFAASQHIQADVPAGVRVHQLNVAETFDGLILASGRDTPGAGMAHVALSPSRLTAEAAVVVAVGAAPGRIRSTTVAAVIGALGLALASVLERVHLINALAGPLPVPSLSLALLFGALALDLLWTARTPGHRFIARVQAPSRFILRLCAVVFGTVCFLMTVPVPSLAWEAGWDVVAGVAAAAGVAFAACARSAAGVGHRSSSHEWAPGRTSTL